MAEAPAGGATERLYYEDPLLLRFEGTVVGHAEHEGRPSVLLDRSAFYPESGGQMADRGTLGGLPIVDVQVDEAGRVHHVLEAPPAAGLDVGAVVAGEIERARRRVHMALHTGQHMLSRALLDVLGGETQSSRLGETECNIDLDLGAAREADLQRAEDLVNQVIDDDVAVRAWFPEPEELKTLPLRRAPKVDDKIRVVAVEGFDFTPCGGTHVTRTGQIGLVRILRTEKAKGKVRVLFTAGARARRHLFAEQDALGALARAFTCGPLEVEAAVEKIRKDLKDARGTLGATRAQLAEEVAGRLLHDEAESAERVVAAFDGVDNAFLRTVAERLTRAGKVALLAAPDEEGTLVLLARPEGSSFDCGAFLKAAAAAAGGRGGGKPESAQGRLEGRVDWLAVVAGLG